MSVFDEARPPGAPGDNFDQKNHEGKLLLMQFSGIERGIKTKLGTSDAARFAQIVDLTTGKIWREAIVWGKALVVQFDGKEPGRLHVGRLVKGAPLQPGQSPPWNWVVGDDNDRQTAERYLAQPQSNPAPEPPQHPAVTTQAYAPQGVATAPAMSGAAAPPPWAQS